MLDELQRRWYQPDSRPPVWAWLVALVFGAVVGIRRALYRHGVLKASRLPVPVIVVGNLVAGGAGKTPLTIALVEALRARGFTPGVVSRGYGGAARELMLLNAAPDPVLCGDEPALIRTRTGAPVAIGARRAQAAALLVGQGVDVIIADDGLQHYALARDVEVCVIDGTRRLGNARLLPAGPLREPASRLTCVDFVVCNGGVAPAGEVPMHLALGDAVALNDGQRRTALATFAGQRVHAVAGIGNPERFFEALRAVGIDVIPHPFADHQQFESGDFAFAENVPVLMTEKDAVKCRAFARDDWWSVPVSATLPEGFFDTLAARLRSIQLAARP